MAKCLAREKSCSEYFLASLQAYGKSSCQILYFTHTQKDTACGKEKAYQERKNKSERDERMTGQSQKYQKYDTIGITGPSSPPQTLIISLMIALRGGDKQAQLHSLNEGEHAASTVSRLAGPQLRSFSLRPMDQALMTFCRAYTFKIARYQFGINKDTEGKRQTHHKRESQIKSR